jgi:hypothetical protein
VVGMTPYDPFDHFVRIDFRGRLKNLLVDAFCHRLLPIWAVQAAFTLFHLYNA